MRGEEITPLKAGIFVLLCGTLLVLGIVFFGGRSQLFAERYRLLAAFKNAAGLIPGSEVRLAGVSVGSVRTVRVVTTQSGDRVVRVEMDIASGYREMITRDSIASIRTLGPLGDKYIEISPGSTGVPVLRPGEYVATEEPEDLYELAKTFRSVILRGNRIAEQVTDALDAFQRTGVIEELRQSATALRRIVETTEKGPGLLHSLIYDEKMVQGLEDMRAAAKSLRESAEAVRNGQGALGELVHGDRAAQAISDLAAASNSLKDILTAVEKGHGTLHALVYQDEGRQTLADMGQAANRLNTILADIQAGRGTLGLLIYDPELWETMKRLLGSAEESKILRFLVRRSAATHEK